MCDKHVISILNFKLSELMAVRVNLRCGRASTLCKVHCSFSQRACGNISDKVKSTLSLNTFKWTYIDNYQFILVNHYIILYWRKEMRPPSKIEKQ